MTGKMNKLSISSLKSVLSDDSVVETIFESFKRGETVELKREQGEIVVIGISRKAKIKCNPQ